MQPFAYLVKTALPNYLTNLPIPDSFTGWFRLGFRDWLSLIPPTAAIAGVSYVTYKALYPQPPVATDVINKQIDKSNPKVVNMIDVEDISEKAVFCRCWKSKNWPYCDGAHATHNKETGDNIGPVVVSRKSK